MYEDMSGQENIHMQGKVYMVLQALATDPEYQRRGIGSQLVRWGLEQADGEKLPCWILRFRFGCCLPIVHVGGVSRCRIQCVRHGRMDSRWGERVWPAVGIVYISVHVAPQQVSMNHIGNLQGQRGV